MRYYLDLFTPETWAAFRKHGGGISGFREKGMTNHLQIELEFLKVIKKVIFVVGPLVIVIIIVCIKWVAIFMSVS